MVAVDEVCQTPEATLNTSNNHQARKELVVGIIDVVRTYTWVHLPSPSQYKAKLTLSSQDKKLESWIKDRGFAGGGRNRPTVTSPKVPFPSSLPVQNRQD